MATVQPTTRVRAVAKDVHISPQKVRLVIDQVRGKRVNEALAILRFLPQGAASEVARVVRSASANAEHNNDMDPEDLDHRARLCGRGDEVEALHCSLARAAGGDLEAVQPHHDRRRGAAATGARPAPGGAARWRGAAWQPDGPWPEPDASRLARGPWCRRVRKRRGRSRRWNRSPHQGRRSRRQRRTGEPRRLPRRSKRRHRQLRPHRPRRRRRKSPMSGLAQPQR